MSIKISETIEIARPTKAAIREMTKKARITKRGLIDAYIDINSGECAGIFWRTDGYSWFENEPKNTYPVHVPLWMELDETWEEWDAELSWEICTAIDLQKQKKEIEEEK